MNYVAFLPNNYSHSTPLYINITNSCENITITNNLTVADIDFYNTGIMDVTLPATIPSLIGCFTNYDLQLNTVPVSALPTVMMNFNASESNRTLNLISDGDTSMIRVFELVYSANIDLSSVAMGA